jgi:DNA polymerase-3 subunit delta'
MADAPEHGATLLPWHTVQWQQFLEQQRAERLPHALLLIGTPGTGRNNFASALARTLLCDAPSDAGYCGACKACRLAATGAHADFLQLAPEEPGKAIGVDAVRKALRFAAGTATQGKRKVMLLSPAEDMTTAAYNAFLKCLEEPAADTFIILVASLGAALPATIRSRCQRWSLPDPDVNAAANWLEETLGTQTTTSQSDAARRYLELLGPVPLQVLAQLEDDGGDALLTFSAALLNEAGAYHPADAERSAATLDPDRVFAACRGGGTALAAGSQCSGVARYKRPARLRGAGCYCRAAGSA